MAFPLKDVRVTTRHLPSAAEVLGGLERRLRLRRGDLNRLLHLDAEEHAALTRVAPAPEPGA